MADSDVYDLSEETEPEARDLLYMVNLSNATVASQDVKVSLASLVGSILMWEGSVVELDDDIITL